MRMIRVSVVLFGWLWLGVACAGEDLTKPYSPPCVERENLFAFTEKPAVKDLGNDRYEIAFAVKGNCDVTLSIVDGAGRTARHLGSGVLGSNAPAPFQKNSLKQTLYWNGKDDLDSYVKGLENFRVRVQLGLKPEFDKRLGGTSPKNLPGRVYGIAASEKGVFVITLGNRYYIRKFDQDGNYLMSLVPPPANLPESKLQGMGCIEYEAGQRVIQSVDRYDTVSTWGNFLPSLEKDGLYCRPVVVGERIFYATGDGRGQRHWALNHIHCDGSTSVSGCQSRALLSGSDPAHLSLAASPDGRELYFTEIGRWDCQKHQAVRRSELEGSKPWTVFLGSAKNEPGSAEGKFSMPRDVDCDAQGRLYVCDVLNNRVQVFSPEGTFLKSLSAGSPRFVAVHRVTGAVYLLHAARVEGKSTKRVTKYRAFDDPTPMAQVDVPSEIMALDSWAPKPRLWLCGGVVPGTDGRQNFGLSIWEEEGRTFKKISDFKEEAKKEDGANLLAWSGGVTTKMACDPVREQLYVGRYPAWSVFDLPTGARLGNIATPGLMDDVAFDKRGYLHCHFNPSGGPGVGRLDPSRTGRGPAGAGYPECPYDYGVEGKEGWLGILPVRDQLGAKFFQDGIGANMNGDIAEQCNIYYAPKLEDEAAIFTMHKDTNGDSDHNNFAAFQADVQQRLKRGEGVYSIRPEPGVPLLGATIWTFERNGELRDECAVTAGGLINGVMMDEDGAVYFVNNRTRMMQDKPFLSGRRGTFGAGPAAKPEDFFTGTLIKTGRKATIRSTRASVPIDERPARPRELSADDYSHKEAAWCEGAEWIYAGASPIVPGGCSCPTMRFHTDWYKRSFVPEAYRHSIGVVDTSGNLILHIGRYGNLDSGDGAKSRIPVGGDHIAIAFNEMVSGTDNHLVFDDHGERIVVLKLSYHAEETAPVLTK